jgi:hypothetical protein
MYKVLYFNNIYCKRLTFVCTETCCSQITDFIYCNCVNLLLLSFTTAGCYISISVLHLFLENSLFCNYSIIGRWPVLLLLVDGWFCKLISFFSLYHSYGFLCFFLELSEFTSLLICFVILFNKPITCQEKPPREFVFVNKH